MKKSFVVVLFLMIFVVSSLCYASGYIGNMSSKKFHYASCHWVGKMNQSNKIMFTSREEAVNRGYIPCKVCHP